MPSLQVRARALLRAELHLLRRGRRRMLESLEQAEPELAGFLMDRLELIERQLSLAVADDAQMRQIRRQVESLLLVSIDAIRSAAPRSGK